MYFCFAYPKICIKESLYSDEKSMTIKKVSECYFKFRIKVWYKYLFHMYSFEFLNCFYKRCSERKWKTQICSQKTRPCSLTPVEVSSRVYVLSCLIVSGSLRPHGLQPARLLCPWDSPGKNTRVGCHALLQEIFPTQGSNQGLEHCRQILYHLNHQGSPRILEYVAYTFSRGFSRPRNQTGISCTAGRFFTS